MPVHNRLETRIHGMDGWKCATVLLQCSHLIQTPSWQMFSRSRCRKEGEVLYWFSKQGSSRASVLSDSDLMAINEKRNEHAVEVESRLTFLLRFRSPSHRMSDTHAMDTLVRLITDSSEGYLVTNNCPSMAQRTTESRSTL